MPIIKPLDRYKRFNNFDRRFACMDLTDPLWDKTDVGHRGQSLCIRLNEVPYLALELILQCRSPMTVRF
jgi:hypothetical protein